MIKLKQARLITESLLLVITLLILAHPASCQDCAVTDTGSDYCQSNNCTYSSSNISTIIGNTTIGNSTFLLCLNLSGQNVLLSSLNNSIQGSILIDADNITFASSLLTVVSSTSNNYSLIRSTGGLYVIEGSALLFDSVNFTGGDMVFGQSTLMISNQLIILADGPIQILDSTKFTAALTFITSMQTLTVNSSNFTSRFMYRCQSSCSCLEENTNECTPVKVDFPRAWVNKTFSLPQLLNVSIMPWYINSFEITLNASQIALQNVNITASGVGFAANSVSFSSTNVSTAGLGCQGSRGLGCGYYDVTLGQLLGCTGTGGSYGGRGGSSSPDTCAFLAPRQTYGSIKDPTMKGSGGGTFQQNSFSISSGGGVIFLQTLNFSMDSQSKLDSDGSSGTLFSSGGGSGGSINIELALLSGELTLSAKGGGGKSSGGGGRIALKFMNWTEPTYAVMNDQQTSAVNVDITGGPNSVSNGSQGLNGSFFTTPCLPGYSLNGVCRVCSAGTFKTTYGYQNCTACLNPPNSYYNSNLVGQSSLNICGNYSCDKNAGYFMDKKNLCITSMEKILSDVGGQNVVISICMILASLIIYGIFVLITKIMKKKDAHVAQPPITEDNLKQFAQKPIFQIEELPYHEFRIYISGSNDPKDPWHLKREALKDVNIWILRSTNFDGFLEEINELGQYKIWQKTLIYFLRVCYFPLAAYVLEKIKEAKAKKLSKVVKKFQKDQPNWEQTTVKLNVKSNNSVACLQIFNYHRSLYDFYLQNCFPLVFVLEKRPLGGYMLDFSDPFLKAMIVYRDEKLQDPDHTFQKYCEQLNEFLLKIPVFDPLFSHLASADRYGVQMYLMQPPDNILNFYPKDRFNSSLELILVVVEENTVCRHFVTSSPLPDFKCLEMDRLRWQLSRRDEERTNIIGVSCLKQTKTKKIIFIWITGVFNVLLFINQAIIFYDMVTMVRNALIYFYFILLPLVEFMNCITLFGWCLKPSFKFGVYSVLFTVANMTKSIILGLVQVILLIEPTDHAQAGFFILGNIVLLAFLMYVERPFLWTCRNL